jgi:hypothetical protein
MPILCTADRPAPASEKKKGVDIMPPPGRLPFGRPGQSVVHLQLGGYCPLAAWQASSPAPYLAHRAAQSKACRLLDSIRTGTSLGPSPFLQGCKTLDPQTAHAMVLAAKPGRGFAKRTARQDAFVSDEEQPLSLVSRKPARRSPGKRGGAR